ncbi:MAG: BrnT family toxin [Spirochaetales bacterium]|nr:BrnT family toxin [Spirochaetales bacterium]
MTIQFEWDPEKEIKNIHKHGIDFEEAKSVFYDINARVIHDPEHSDNEDRFIILGLSVNLSLLIVCHCYRESDEIIRIISARKASKKESRVYGGYLK